MDSFEQLREAFRTDAGVQAALVERVIPIGLLNSALWPMGAVITALLLRDSIGDQSLVLWTIATATTSSLLQLTVIATHRMRAANDLSLFTNRYAAALFVGATPWALALLLALPDSQDDVDMAIGAAIVVMSASAAISYGGVPTLMAANHLGLWLPAIVVWATQGNVLRVGFCVFCCAAAVAYGAFSFRELARGERARHTAEAVAHELAISNVRDPLTSVLNRRGILEKLEARVEADDRPVVLFIDLDGFKAINDTHGHQIGDLVLKSTADILVHIAGDESDVGRIGGDEFIVLVDRNFDATSFARRIREEIGAETEHFSPPISASVGRAIPSSSDTATELLHRADMAMYDAKTKDSTGLSTLRAGEINMFEQGEIRRHDLRIAIAQAHITFDAQPIVDLQTGTWFAIELLARWNHPVHGAVSPAEFVPLAEELELDIELGRLALDAAGAALACSDLECAVSINITARHFVSGQLVDDILAVARHHGVSPTRFVVEITESQSISNISAAALIARELRSHGVSLALDDFGTGFSSMLVLVGVPFQLVKLPPDFGVNSDDPNQQHAIERLVAWAREFTLDLVIEGLDEPMSIEPLRRIGVPYAQGYFFQRPEPLATMLSSLRHSATAS